MKKEETLSYLSTWQNQISPIFLTGLWAHLPFLILIGWFLETNPLLITFLGIGILALPTWLYRTKAEPLLISISIGIASMGISGVLIHAMRGMIEAHFHIFVLLALLLVFGSARVILAAAVTIALHHIGGWLWFQSSVFNYEASFGIVLLHALFVILQAIPSIKIAAWFRSFIIARGCMQDVMLRAANQLQTEVETTSSHCEDLGHHTDEQTQAVYTIQECFASIDHHLKETDRICLQASQTESIAQGLIREGRHSMQELSQMKELNQKFQAHLHTSMERNLKILNHLQSVFEDVRSTTLAVSEIADQSRLLSINARIEAARAGQQGKGFGVVADSMGELATQSQNHSNQIDARIQASFQALIKAREDARITMDSTLKDSQELEEGIETISQNCNRVFGEVIRNLTDLGEQVQSISRNSTSQVNELHTFTHAIDSVLHLTQSSRSRVQEVRQIVTEVENEVFNLRTVNDQILHLTSSSVLDA